MWHRWIGEDEHVSCLVCGGTWNEDGTAANGDEAVSCTGDTSQSHGDPRETGDDPSSVNGDCNCLFCR